MYHELDAPRITGTARQLHQRICERFPESSLSRVSADLCGLARDCEGVSIGSAAPTGPSA